MINYLGFINKELILFTSVYIVVVLVINSIWLHPKGLAPFKEWIIEFISGRWKWFRSFSALKQAYIAAAGAIGLALLVLFVILYLQVIKIPFYPEKLDESELRNLAIAFIGTITGIGALFGVYLAILKSETTERQTYTEEQGLITDRLNKATEGLGKKDGDNPLIEVRLGALYALERIAKDSIRDHVQIMEILCAYIRTNRPLPNENDEVKEISEDIQAALTIIGRSKNWSDSEKRIEQETEQGYQIDMSYCDLHGAQLNKANLSNANLNNTNLENAQLRKAILVKTQFEDANLNKAILNSANMTYASLRDAKLIRAKLSDADMSHARLIRADMSHASLYSTNLSHTWVYSANMSHTFLYNANLKYANLANTNLSHANLLRTSISQADTETAYAYAGNFLRCKDFSQEQLDAMYCGIKVKIPEGLERPDHWPKEVLTEDEFKIAREEWEWEYEQEEAEEMAAEAERANQAHMDAEGLAMDMKGE